MPNASQQHGGAAPAPGSGPYPFLRPAQGPDELGRLGGYRILRVLGEGGMGIIFEAEDVALHRRVAVKVLKPSLTNATFRKRFAQEARIAAALPHDHIVTIFQVGEDNGVPFLAMEYLHGQSLEERLQRDRWLPLAEALSITRQVAEGLALAHGRGLIHRDIKPANLFLEADHADGPFRRVKILDFGLARPIEGHSNLTAQGQILATPGYMAPEIVRGQAVDARTDLYGLGCVLYRMLTGRTPFDAEGRDTMEFLTALVQCEPQPAEELAPQLPAPVAELIRQFLARDPDDRPPSARAVIDRLRVLDPDAPPAAAVPPEGWAAPPGAARPRRRVGPAVVAGALTILAALLVGAVVGYQKFFSGTGESAGATGPEPTERR